jgi:thymidine phosphorylase
VAARLGAGRARKGEAIDHAVGVVVHAKVGDEIAAGDVLAEAHARTRHAAEAAAGELAGAFELTDRTVARPSVVIETVA